LETLFSLFLLIFLNPVSPLRAFLRPRAYLSGNSSAKIFDLLAGEFFRATSAVAAMVALQVI